MAADTTGAPIVKLDGTALSTEGANALVDLKISKTTGAAGFCELRFERNASLGIALTVGSTLVVEATESNGDNTVIFKGDVMTLGIEHSTRQSYVAVGAYDASYKLGNQIDSTSHLNTTFGGVVNAIADAAGLSAKVDSSLSGRKFEHIQQSGTPHQFLSTLARNFGCEWFVDGAQLVVRRRDPQDAVETLSGMDQVRRFSARFSGTEQAKSVDVRGWDPSKQTFVNHKVDSAGKVTGHTVPVAKKAVKGSFPGKDVVAAPTSVSSPAEAKLVAEGILGRIEASKLTGRGEIDVNGKLVPGVVIKIEDFDPLWNGEYYLTGVDHQFGRSQPFITKFAFGSLEPTTLVDLLGHQQPTSNERLTSGISIGEVTDAADPDGLLRVKVTLPVLSGDNVSHWARVVSAGAGKGRGSMVIPEVGDEVAVAFENGDLQRPYVLGGLWNGKSTAPEFPDLIKNGKVMGRSITSREGHELLLSDGDGAEDLFVKITTSDKKTILNLGHTMIEMETEEKPIKITNGKGTVQIAKNGDISIDGNNITIKAKADIEISGVNVKIDAKSKFEAGGATADVKAKSKLSLEGSAMAEVKGGMVKIN